MIHWAHSSLQALLVFSLIPCENKNFISDREVVFFAKYAFVAIIWKQRDGRCLSRDSLSYFFSLIIHLVPMRNASLFDCTRVPWCLPLWFDQWMSHSPSWLPSASLCLSLLHKYIPKPPAAKDKIPFSKRILVLHTPPPYK